LIPLPHPILLRCMFCIEKKTKSTCLPQVMIPSVKLDFSHVQSKCGSLDKVHYSAGGGNVSDSAEIPKPLFSELYLSDQPLHFRHECCSCGVFVKSCFRASRASTSEFPQAFYFFYVGNEIRGHDVPNLSPRRVKFLTSLYSMRACQHLTVFDSFTSPVDGEV